MKLTIVICTHNRRALLGRTVESLNAARRPARWDVEVLVIANACTDDTRAWLAQYTLARRNSLPLRFGVESAAGKANALNRAVRLLNGDVAAFVDDDHRVDPGYLSAISEAADSHPEAALFCGRIIPDWDGREPSWVHDTGPYRVYPLPVPRFDHGEAPRAFGIDDPVPGGGNLAVRTQWFGRVGPFDTDFGPVGHNLAGGEDILWVRRAQQLGADLFYVPVMLQYHYVDLERLRFSYLIRKAYARSAATACINGGNGHVPLYAYRKVVGYLAQALISWSIKRRRFFLIRLAAALGEIKGNKRSQGSLLRERTFV